MLGPFRQTHQHKKLRKRKTAITRSPYLERRYDARSRTFLAFMAVAGALLIHIGMSLFAGAQVFERFFGIDETWSILIISVITAIYTVLGGLKAVVVTEAIQTLVLLFGTVLVTLLAIAALPDHGIHSFFEFKEALKPDQFSMIHPLRNAEGKLTKLSWLAVLLGYPVLGIWYWCSDQTIVQRVLGARSQRDAQLGLIFAGFPKILPVFLMVLPGVVAYVLFKDKIGGDNNQALPVLILELVPAGLKGVILTGMLAASMSTIAGAPNSTATLVAVDSVKRIRPETGDSAQVTIGRISCIIVMLLAMLWSTQGDKFTSIFEAINKIPLCFAPAITCVFLWGVFWPRGTKEASLITLTLGFIIGGIDFALDLPLVGETRFFTDTLGVPFMHQGGILCLICSVIYVVASLMTPKPDPEELQDLCWTHPLEILRTGKVTGFPDPRFAAGILFTVMIVLYVLLR